LPTSHQRRPDQQEACPGPGPTSWPSGGRDAASHQPSLPRRILRQTPTHFAPMLKVGAGGQVHVGVGYPRRSPAAGSSWFCHPSGLIIRFGRPMSRRRWPIPRDRTAKGMKAFWPHRHGDRELPQNLDRQSSSSTPPSVEQSGGAW